MNSLHRRGSFMRERVPALLLVACISAFPALSVHTGLSPCTSAHAAESGEEKVPLTFKSVIGNWLLKYPGNYGYRFNLHPNYRAAVIIYLNNETLFFNGVYTISDTDKLRINIYEMKVEHRSAPGRGRGYVKAKSSYFLFSGHKVVRNRAETLHLRPLAIIIDGVNSEGYFEPLIKLGRVR